MKNLFIGSVICLASFSMTACNNTNKPAANSTKETTDSTKKIPTNSTSIIAKTDVDPKIAVSVKEMVGNYLQLKNALTKDNSNDAATAGKALSDAFAKLDQSMLTPAQKKSFTDIAGDAKEMAEHIGLSAGNLPHQREHFDMLSQDMYDLVKLFGAGQPLFVDHCPIFNDKKGAIWLSETKDIKNPYTGSAMSTCGTIMEELK